MSVKVRTKGAEKAGWQRSLASRTPKSIILGAVAWLNFSANATALFPLIKRAGADVTKPYQIWHHNRVEFSLSQKPTLKPTFASYTPKSGRNQSF
jgi:hypothetical protein